MKVNESDFEYRGYRCVTTFTDMGERCGYVGLPERHPLYGKGFGSQVKATIKDLIASEETENKRNPMLLFCFSGEDEDNQVRLEAYFNVHGGITYAMGGRDSSHPINSDLWWLGFDCGHYGDGKDLDLLEQLWGDDENIQKRIEFEREHFYGGIIRSKEYVQQECRNLVDQIIDLVDRYYQ